MSIESMMPSNSLILCRPLFLLPSIFPSIRVFLNESALRIRWPKYCSFSFNISPSNEHPGLIIRIDWWISLQSKGLSKVFSNTTVQKHQFFGAQLCPTLCDSMDCSISWTGFPVYHQFLEFTQTHMHWVGDAIQPSHPLSSPSPPALNLSQHKGLFQWVSSSHQVARVLEFQHQHQSFQWIFRTDFL